MKVLRSVAGIFVGMLVAMIVIFALEIANFAIFRPDDGKSFTEQAEQMKANKPAAKEWLHSLPETAHVLVLFAWTFGSFLGGMTSACIAGRGQMLHAGVIGALILAGTVFNFINMKNEFDYTHPNWVILAGLLLPLPMSLLGGKLVSPKVSPSPPVSHS